MLDVPDEIDGTPGCATCGSPLVAERYVHLRGAGARESFCSRSCLRTAVRALKLERRATRYRKTRSLAIAIVLSAAFLAPRELPLLRRSPRLAAVTPLPPPEEPAPLPPGWFGPDWPPTETDVLAVLGRDAWVHPLAGPSRRMPRSDSRVFGAVRPGMRAIECRNGHCGVDLGGEIWGEHVRAAHDGVIDWVQRGPNPDHGGRFVRISHHDGTVFTQYFHLAAIPRGLERGVPVKCGQVIGLLGDSGVKESQPHLHFSVSVRLPANGYERYIDPEPLIALWPLRVPVEGSEVGLVTILAPPGLPLGSAARRARATKGATKADQPPANDAKASAPDEANPSPDEQAPADPGDQAAPATPDSPAEQE